MHRSFLSLLALATAGLLVSGSAQAGLTEDYFFMRNAQDLVTICSSPEDDPLNDAADHFCHGFVSGAWQYHQAMAAGPKGVRIVCPSDPPPTRNEAIAGFVAWSAEHPEHMAEPAVEAMFRFLVEKWPCPEGDSQ